jgi:competence protein ComEA
MSGMALAAASKASSVSRALWRTVALLAWLGSFVFAAPQQKQGPIGKVNINTATRTELMQIPKIGEKMADRIVEFRKANGPFTRVEEIMNVKGMGEKTFLAMKHQLTVGAKPPGGAKKPLASAP